MRENYRNGIQALLQLQEKLGHRPKRHHVSKLVDRIVKDNHLRHDPRLHYFQLLATCALLGREPLYNRFKSIKKKRRANVSHSTGTADA